MYQLGRLRADIRDRDIERDRESFGVTEADRAPMPWMRTVTPGMPGGSRIDDPDVSPGVAHTLASIEAIQRATGIVLSDERAIRRQQAAQLLAARHATRDDPMPQTTRLPRTPRSSAHFIECGTSTR